MVGVTCIPDQNHGRSQTRNALIFTLKKICRKDNTRNVHLFPQYTIHYETHARHFPNQFFGGQFRTGLPGFCFIPLAQRIGRRIRSTQEGTSEGLGRSRRQFERAATKEVCGGTRRPKAPQCEEVVAVLMLACESQSRIPSTHCVCALAHSRVAYTSDYYMHSKSGPAATLAEDFANGVGLNRYGLLSPGAGCS